MSSNIQTVIMIAKNAGGILLDFYSKNYNVSQKYSDPKVLVTDADLASEKYIIEELRKSFPNYQIVSEEQRAHAVDWTKEVFLIDPLDGTKQFVAKTPNFSIIIGLCVSGQPTLGVVFLPLLGELYFAEKGKGAFFKKQLQIL